MPSYICPTNRILGAGKYIWPSWRRAMTAQTWVEVPASNVLEDIDPSDDPAINPDHPSTAQWQPTLFSRVMSAWSGAAWRERDSTMGLMLHGGHGDYWGNEPYEICLEADTPFWRMLRNPSGAVGNAINLDDGQEATGLYADGRIRATHTYSTLVHIPGVGWGITAHGASAPSAQDPNSKPVLIDEHTGEMIRHGADGGFTNTGNGVYDPTRHCFWVHRRNGFEVYKYDIAADEWTTYTSSFGSTSGQANLCYLPEHDLIFIRRGSSSWVVYDPTDNTMTEVTTSGSGIVGKDVDVAQPALCEYDNSLYFWHQSSDTEKLTRAQIPADPKNDTWVISTVTPDAANAITPSACQSTGTYGRFGYSRKLDGFYLVNRVDEPIYFYARTA